MKALFIKELDKVYQSGVPEDDLRERAEEMERMREHVFKGIFVLLSPSNLQLKKNSNRS